MNKIGVLIDKQLSQQLDWQTSQSKKKRRSMHMHKTRFPCVVLAIIFYFALISGLSIVSAAFPGDSGTISFTNGNLAYDPAATIEVSYANIYNGTPTEQASRIVNGVLPTGTLGDEPIEVLAPRAWNCWGAPAGPVTVTLTWPTPQVIGSTRVLWWYDNGETPLPTGCTLQYYDGNGFVDVTSIGLRGDGYAGVNRWWQGADFAPITTTQLRLVISRSNGAGMGCWEVFGPTDPEDHLLLRYDFDGDALDSSGHGFDGTVMGTTYEWVNDPYFDSQVLSLTGGASGSAAAGYVSLPNDCLEDAKNTSVTVSTWYRTNYWETYARLFDFGLNQTSYYILANKYPNGGASARLSRSGPSGEYGQSIAVPLPTDNMWHNVVTVLDTAARELRIYVDGELKATEIGVELTLRDVLGTGSQNILSIGRSLFPDPFLNARIRDFRIYNMALPGSYIEGLYRADTRTITAIAPVAATAKFGIFPTLPGTVEVTFEDSGTGTVDVTWLDIESTKLFTEKSFIVYGTVAGTDIPAVAVVTVEPTQSLSDSYGIVLKASCALREPIRFTAAYTISNYADEIGMVTVHAAIYDDAGVIKALKPLSLTIAKGTFVTGSLTVDLPVGLDPIDTVMKAFVFDSVTGEPLTRDVIYYYGLKSLVDDVLMTESMFKTSQQVGEAFLLSFDIDRLVAPFYNRAAEQLGIPSEAKAPNYGSWEAHGMVAGHSLGHWLSAASLMYRQTGNPVLLERIDYAVSELAYVQDEEGYLGGQVTRSQFELYINGVTTYWAPWYVLHKLYQGLIDAYTLTGNEQAFEAVLKYSDWAADRVGRRTHAQNQIMLSTEYGGIGDSIALVYRLAVDAGIPNAEKYLKLAKEFDRDWLYDPLAAGVDNLADIHANTQIPAVIGAAQLYEITGDDYYRRVCENFWDFTVNKYSYANGGHSDAEHYRVDEILSDVNTETCNSFNMLKLTEHQFDWNRDVKYADYYERVLYNHILPSQNPSNGGKTYFVPLHPLGSRSFSTSGFECCMGTGMENPARYSKFIYFRDARNLYVNLFIPSTLNWAATGLSLIQDTNFPYADTTKLTITKGADDIDIHIRVPGWAAGPVVVTVNGIQAASQREAGYIKLSGDWEIGDVIEVKLPMNLHLYTSRYIPSVSVYTFDSVGYAVLFGPILLAADFRTQNLDTLDYYQIQAPSNDPADWIKRVSETALIFEMSPDTSPGEITRTFIPFYDLLSRYTVYWKLEFIDTRVRIEGRTTALCDSRTTEEITLKAVLADPDTAAVYEWSLDNDNFTILGDQNTATLDLKAAARGNTTVTCKLTLSGGEEITVTRALKAGTIAMLARVSTSYVSPWETLEAVNDGVEPIPGGRKLDAKPNGKGYGNWNDPSPTQWLQYDFDRTYTVDSTDVWWWSDTDDPYALFETDHLRFPASWICEYLDEADGQWKQVMPTGDPAYPLVDCNYSTCTFEPVIANGLRITISRRPDCWTGALQWRVNGTPFMQPSVNISVDNRLIIAPVTREATSPSFSLYANAAVSGNLIVASYDARGALASTAMAPFSLAEGEEATIAAIVPTVGVTYKFFIWDASFRPMTAITSVDDIP